MCRSNVTSEGGGCCWNKTEGCWQGMMAAIMVEMEHCQQVRGFRPPATAQTASHRFNVPKTFGDLDEANPLGSVTRYTSIRPTVHRLHPCALVCASGWCSEPLQVALLRAIPGYSRAMQLESPPAHRQHPPVKPSLFYFLSFSVTRFKV